MSQLRLALFLPRFGIVFLLLGAFLLLPGCQSSGDAEQRTVGQVTDDVAIETSIRSRLIADKRIASRRIEIDVVKGKVIFFGRVRDEDTRGLVLDIARSVRGVTEVEDRLTLVPE
ncbi:MAG: BON domain-containing protein [Pseudomonadales bacterium]